MRGRVEVEMRYQRRIYERLSRRERQIVQNQKLPDRLWMLAAMYY